MSHKRPVPVVAEPSHGSRKDEIERLRQRLAGIRDALGVRVRFPKEAQRLEDLIIERRIAIAALEFRLDATRRVVEEINTKMAALNSEIGGYEAGLEALLRTILEDAAEWSRPMWSPIPVFGYRLWWISPRGLQGATRFVWRQPHLSARCGGAGGADDGEVPHTDGRCGNPPCGIYALKDAATPVRFGVPTSEEGHGVVVGLVAMSGKVVEHDRGYRSQHARVVAASALQPGRIVAGSDPAWIYDLFRDPIGTIARADSLGEGPDAYTQILRFFNEAQHREEQRWTLGNRSA